MSQGRRSTLMSHSTRQQNRTHNKHLTLMSCEARMHLTTKPKRPSAQILLKRILIPTGIIAHTFIVAFVSAGRHVEGLLGNRLVPSPPDVAVSATSLGHGLLYIPGWFPLTDSSRLVHQSLVQMTCVSTLQHAGSGWNPVASTGILVRCHTGGNEARGTTTEAHRKAS